MDIILSLFRGKSNDLGNSADSAAAALWPAGLPEPGNLFRNIVFALSIHHPDVAPRQIRSQACGAIRRLRGKRRGILQ
ncbi:MAG: hypothetical protein C4589_00275 [Peptococcaceae bacterium]|nr:MAG: hypothetical protein C4589_00275 [Peptococcaceae bacterium]